jgi:hypothetical protein
MASPKMTPGSGSSNGRSTGPTNTPNTTPSTGARSTPGTGASDTPNSDPSTGGNNGQRFGQSFDHRLAISSRGDSPALVLIRDIPSPEKAIGDFHGVPANSYPHRDIPSILIAHIGNPETLDFKTKTLKLEPDWLELLEHFSSKRAMEGMANLQDLYIFITRLAIPNAIIQNRMLILAFYTDLRGAPQNIRLRYDAWAGDNYIAPEQEQPLPDDFQRIAPRPILSSGMTPNGTNFIQWLDHMLTVQLDKPYPHSYTPPQQVHRITLLDPYLEENEASVRLMHPRALMHRTARVLNMFWWVCQCNAKLAYYRSQNWAGMRGEVG